MRRRLLFPGILLTGVAILSALAAAASQPITRYEYLHALIEDDRRAGGTIWREANIPHADELSPEDRLFFTRAIDRFDGDALPSTDRHIFIGQARREFEAAQRCVPDKAPCERLITLNRTLEPTFIHGDLRILNLLETSVIQSVEHSQDGDVSFIGLPEKRVRQVRFIQTERGWVLKSVDVLSSDPIEGPSVIASLDSPVSGVNYYPASAPWDAFWPSFPEDTIAEDLDVVAALGANSLRIFLQHDHFSALDTQEEGLLRLRRFLDMAAARDLSVIVTLFDLRSDYRVTQWSHDSAHIQTILDHIADHPALLAIDLKNQADLDFAQAGEPLVMAWVEAMILSVKQTYPTVPLTVGWSDTEHGTRLADRLDLVSVHDYRDPNGLADRIQTVRKQIGDRPLFVTEIGHSRWSVFGDKTPEQGVQLSAQLKQLTDIDGVFVWTLHDFEQVGAHIVGPRPWRQAQQKHYGIIAPDGSWLPSAEAFHQFNSTFHHSTQ